MKCRVANKKQLDKVRRETVYALSPVAILSILWVCESRFHFGYDKMQKAADKISARYDDISQGYVSFEDLKECLKDVDGVDIPFDMKCQPYNTIDDARRIAEYTQKAFATAVFCSVLCDKFDFHSVKATQAIKQFCTVFDELKYNDDAIRKLQERYFTDYQIRVT